jgi:hypothetical protein
VLAAGCQVTREAEDTGLDHRRFIVHLACPDIPGIYIPLVHEDCCHNERMAIYNRVIGRVPRSTVEGIRKLRAGFNLLSKYLPQTTQEPLGEFAMKYHGAKRARYLNACQHVLDSGITRRDAGVTMFVKMEKVQLCKDPRAIQFRDPKYCVMLASFLKPMEHLIYSLKPKHPMMSGTRIVGKGLNQVERAKLLMKKMAYFTSPVILGLDMSRFDKHVDKAQLREEHRFYLKSNNDPQFAELLSWQLKNHVTSKHGFKYVVNGGRMSGDMNTALGNCVIVCAMVIGFMLPRNERFDILDDGDDCLLIVESESVPGILRDIEREFLSFGHELKIEKVAYELEQALWCQSNPVLTKYGYKFVRNPFKVMSSCLVGTRWLRVPTRVRREFLAGLAECEYVLNLGVPVLQEYALALKRNSQGAKLRFDKDSGEWFKYLRESKLYKRLADAGYDEEITDASRISFQKAFGVTIDQQIQFESTLRSWNFRLDGDVIEAETCDPVTSETLRPRWEFQWG